ncbi:MAG: potassium channel protein [Deltaproteobacteria bacterium]|nr:potassium channel protein [Deltaproteobacteria bacterium]
MTNLRQIVLWASSLALILGLGSLGFILIEGWNFLDAFYMVVTTLTTVGYGEIRPLSQIGRIYNIFLIFLGVGVMLYIVSAVARMVVEGEFRDYLGKRKLRTNIKRLKNHYIICGFGRIGEIIARQLTQAGQAVVVIENDPELIARLEAAGYYFVGGDATREEVLLEAGIQKAKGLVAVVSSDAGNVYITLTARSLSPEIFIVARGEELGSEKKLLRAGADRVESPYELGGRKMAQTILRPTVVTFIELAMKEEVDLSMEEVVVDPASSLVGLPLKDSGIRQQLNLIVVAIKRAEGEMLYNPLPETPILAGDTLIVLGLRQNLEALEQMVSR